MSDEMYRKVARRAATALVVWQAALVVGAVALVARADSALGYVISLVWCAVTVGLLVRLLLRFDDLLA